MYSCEEQTFKALVEETDRHEFGLAAILYWNYSQSHLGWHFRKLKTQSSNVSFATFQWKETFELWALSFETAFENVTPSGIGCTCLAWIKYYNYNSGERSCRITYIMFTHTLCVSCWKDLQSHVFRSRCTITRFHTFSGRVWHNIPYMHHAGAGFSKWRWPNMPTHCCVHSRWHNDAMRSSPHHHGHRVNLKGRIQKNTVIKSAPHVHTYRPTNPAICFAQLHSSSAQILCTYSSSAFDTSNITVQTLQLPSHAIQRVDASELFALFQDLLALKFEPTASIPALRRPHHVANHLQGGLPWISWW